VNARTNLCHQRVHYYPHVTVWPPKGGAEYAVIELAAPAGLRQKFSLHCGHSFPDPEDAAAFQYTP